MTGENEATPGPSRLTPIPVGEWPPEMRDALAALRPANARHPMPERRDDRPKGLNVLGTLARHTDLARAFHTFNGHVLFGTTLTTRQRELLVLRVGVRRNCEYEWAQHVVLARDLGFSDDEIEAVRTGPGAEGWDSLEALLLRAADELVDDARIGDDTWAGLAEQFDDQQLMDVIFTVGAYEALAMAFNSFGLELDDDLRSHFETPGGNGLLLNRDH
jgi:alkylhydroperoxidase family enzyme